MLKIKSNLSSHCPTCSYGVFVLWDGKVGGNVECSCCGNKGVEISRVWNEIGVKWESGLNAIGQIVKVGK